MPENQGFAPPHKANLCFVTTENHDAIHAAAWPAFWREAARLHVVLQERRRAAAAAGEPTADGLTDTDREIGGPA